MKNFSLLRPKVLAFGMSVLCALGYSVPAQAHWEVRLSFSRELAATSWDSNVNAMRTTNYPTTYSATQWQSSGEVVVSNSLFGASGRSGGTASANQKNVVTGELRWIPGYNQTLVTDPHTGKVFVKLRGQATTPLTPEANSTHSESNGLKVPSVKTSTTTNGNGQTSVTWSSSNWSGTPIILAIDNKSNSSTIEFGPFEVSSQGTVRQPTSVFSPYPGASYVTDYGSSVSVFTMFGAELTNIGAFISSPIETSWKKFVGAASNLPLAYRQRAANGAYTNQPNNNAVQVSGTHTANDTSDDVWKLACLRKADGKMEVESVATTVASASPISPSPAVTPTQCPTGLARQLTRQTCQEL